MKLKVHIMASDRHKNVAGLNHAVNGISNGNTYINKDKNMHSHRCISTQKDHILTQK